MSLQKAWRHFLKPALLPLWVVLLSLPLESRAACDSEWCKEWGYCCNSYNTACTRCAAEETQLTQAPPACDAAWCKEWGYCCNSHNTACTQCSAAVATPEAAASSGGTVLWRPVPQPASILEFLSPTHVRITVTARLEVGFGRGPGIAALSPVPGIKQVHSIQVAKSGVNYSSQGLTFAPDSNALTQFGAERIAKGSTAELPSGWHGFSTHVLERMTGGESFSLILDVTLDTPVEPRELVESLGEHGFLRVRAARADKAGLLEFSRRLGDGDIVVVNPLSK
jgi:hypothetical protein